MYHRPPDLVPRTVGPRGTWGAEHVVVVVRGTAGGGEDVAEVDLVVHVPVDAHSRAGCEW